MSMINGARHMCEGAYEFTSTFCAKAKPLLRSTDGADTLLRFMGESVALQAIVRRTHDVAKPLFLSIGMARAWMSVARLVWAVDDFTSGRFIKDVKDGKTLSVIASASFLVARVLSTAKWCVQVGLLETIPLSSHVQKIGNLSFFARYATHPSSAFIRNAPYIDLLFISALSALAANNIVGLVRGQQIEKNSLELVSLSADIALCTLGLVVKVHPFTNALLGTIAAGVGVAAFYYDPQNSSN